MSRRLLAGATLAALAALAGSVAIANAYLVRGVIGNGGQPATGGGLAVNGTVGQAITGGSGGPGTILGHGFWVTAGARVTAVDPGQGDGSAPGLRLGRTYPNPSRDVVSLTVSLPRAGRVRVSVFDVSGREVGATSERDLGAGAHRIDWRAPAGCTGAYFLRLSVDGRTVGSRRITLVR